MAHPREPGIVTKNAAQKLARAHYENAELYDRRYARWRGDVAFYSALAKRARGPIVELGAGTGRVTLPLLAQGARVVAVEREAGLRARLAKKLLLANELPRGARCQIVSLDFTRALPRGRFALIIAPFNTLAHVHDAERLLALLKNVRAHLVRGGKLAFDVPLPDPDDMRRDPDKQYRLGRVTGSNGIRYSYSESFDYDHKTQLLLTLCHYDVLGHGPEHPDSFVLPLLHRMYFPEELAFIVRQAGLAIAGHDGDFAGSPIEQSSSSQVLVCTM